MNDIFGGPDYLNSPEGEVFAQPQSPGHVEPGWVGERTDVGFSLPSVSNVFNQLSNSAPNVLPLTDGRWTYHLFQNGLLRVVAGPSAIGQEFAPGDARHTAMLVNLMADNQQADAIRRFWPAASNLRADTSSSAGKVNPPASNPAWTDGWMRGPVRTQPYEAPSGITSSWWFWPAVGAAAVVVVGVGYRLKNR